MHPDSQPTLRIKLERLNFSYGLADHVFCRLPSVKELIEECSNRDVQLIDGVLNAPRVRDAHQRVLEEEVRLEYAKSDETLLVFAGRLSDEKNASAAVGVLKQLPSSYRLVVVGDGPERDAVENEIEQQGVQERVTMTGELSHEDALTIIASADGLLLPPHTESYGPSYLKDLHSAVWYSQLRSEY
jgi:glycosyltransferase involved in cell wall biosynthesis